VEHVPPVQLDGPLARTWGLGHMDCCADGCRLMVSLTQQ